MVHLFDPQPNIEAPWLSIFRFTHLPKGPGKRRLTFVTLTKKGDSQRLIAGKFALSNLAYTVDGDEIHFAPPKKTWNDSIPPVYQQTMASHGFFGGAESLE